MSIEPKTFFIGIVDFFSVLLPGALLALFIQESHNQFLSDLNLYARSNDVPTWVAFLFIAYVLGHLVFLVGTLLDQLLYDPIRNSTPERESNLLAADKELPSILDRFLAPMGRILIPVRRILTPVRRILAAGLVKKDSDDALDQAILIKEYYVNKLGLRPGVNAFQWCKAKLALDNRLEALATVQRFEADSKFFRSFSVVIVFFFFWKIFEQEYTLAIVSLLFLILAIFRYFDQRLKATNQAYWYIITIEAANPTGYRGTRPSRAGGVVYRQNHKHSEIEYLIVQAKDDPNDWVLPKGHIEQDESAEAAAVREVSEETGFLADIEARLGTTSFRLGKEHVEVQFYLMVFTGDRCEPQEVRRTEWLRIKEAVKLITHKESREMLLRAQLRLNPERSLVTTLG